MKQIPTNVPVFIQDFKSNQNARYSTAKLKIFYVGETPDHRLFTQNFSDKILKTLPYTPVVGFYSDEDEDFKGHNSTQYVYGVVPGDAEITYEEEEETGKKFAVTDVILYTERQDNIGEVAQKIVGKQHSLELDPRTLQYKINRDNKGNFVNIQFTDGQFIGLSVLGDSETPAFTNSGFFAIDSNIEQFSTECHAKLDAFLNYLNNDGGKLQVFNSVEFFSKTGEFLAKTMQEFQEEIYRAIDKAGICAWLCENTTEYAVVQQWSDEANRWQYMKYTLSKAEDGSLFLENPVEVRARFLTSEEEAAIESAADTNFAGKDNSEDDKEEDKPNSDNTTEEDDKDKDDKDEFADNKDDAKEDDEEEKKDVDEYASTKEDENKSVEDDDTNKEDEEKNKVGNATADSGIAALSDEERDELNRYRKAAKIATIDSYKEDLSEDILNKYREAVDNYSQEDLESKLAIEFRAFMKSNKNHNNDAGKMPTQFASITPIASYNENDVASVVNKYKQNN